MNQGRKIAIALGSNVGERELFIQKAIVRLEDEFLTEIKASSVYETEPYGIVNQPKFLNAVVTGWSDWKPPAIVNFLKNLERELGRTVTLKNGPREIDLDLLIFGEEVWKSEGVEVPHPGLSERRFVLEPLAELWPDWKHPVKKRTVAEMLKSLPLL